jgi:hypothetical protein
MINHRYNQFKTISTYAIALWLCYGKRCKTFWPDASGLPAHVQPTQLRRRVSGSPACFASRSPKPRPTGYTRHGSGGGWKKAGRAGCCRKKTTR